MSSHSLPSLFALRVAEALRAQQPFLSAVFGRSGGAAAPPQGSATAPGSEECRAALRSVMEMEIIPRLLQGRRRGAAMAAAPSEQGSRSAAPVAQTAPAEVDIQAFANLCAAGDRVRCAALVERLRADGLQPDSVLMDLVAPAARYLGRQWEDDRLDFMAVTLGLVLMHEVIHALGYEIQDGPQASSAVLRVMLASAPGSQHVLGLSIVSEFFRKASWQVVLEVSPSSPELCRAVHNEWFDLLGLSVGLDTQLPELPGLIARLRQASRNPDVPVLLGGPVFMSGELRAQAFGAQAICLDPRESLKVARELVGR